MDIAREIFRAYDIRGIVDKTLTIDAVFQIGQAVASKVLENGEDSLVVGRDGRLSGSKLLQAFIEGASSTGCNVIDIGQVATPVLYFATYALNTPSGIMLTGSHNPPDYNGIKIVLSGQAIFGYDILNLYSRIRKRNFLQGKGKVQEQKINKNYVNYVADNVVLRKPLKLVVDCGNGIAGAIVPELYRTMGCEVIPLYCEVDGNFPNHHPDPGDPSNLQDLIASVLEHQADLGFGYDGDGDRLGVVDNMGKIIWPDRFLMLLAQDVLKRVPGATIIYDIKSTRHLADVIKEYNGNPLMWKTGHSLIKDKMRETGAMLAGEMSGHVFFKERWFGFDDALYTGARLLEILSNMDEDSGTVFAKLPESKSTPEISVQVTEQNKFNIIDQLIKNAEFGQVKETSTIDGLRVEFDNGWGLVRPSNTTPKLICRFEADNENALKNIQDKFKKNLLQIEPDLELMF